MEDGISTKPNAADEQQPYSKRNGEYLPKDGSSSLLNEQNDDKRNSSEPQRGQERPTSEWKHADEIGPVEQKIIDAARNGQPMTFKQIEESPAYNKAFDKYKEIKMIEREDPNYIAIVDSVYQEAKKTMIGEGAKVTPKKERKAFLCIGLPASGKSSSLGRYCNDEKGYVEMDVDEVRKCEKLKETYSEGLGAGKVQYPASDALKMIRKDAIDEGINMAFPLVASDLDSLNDLIDELTNNGYDIEVELNRTKMGICLPRVVKRYLEDGRFLEPPYLLKCSSICPKIYKSIKEEYEEKGTINGKRIKSLRTIF